MGERRRALAWAALAALWLAAMGRSLPRALTALTAAVALAPVTPTPDARVAAGRGGLRLRASPSLEAEVLRELIEFTPLRVVGRTPDGSWLQVTTAEGERGWVWAAYVDVGGAGSTPPVPQGVADLDPAPVLNGVAVLSGVSDRAREIFRRGQQLGNRANVFTTVGDSITDTSFFLHAIGDGIYDLAGYRWLAPALEHFRAAEARPGLNPFANRSLAAAGGWSSSDVLTPGRLPGHAAPGSCLPEETPLVCEYRTVRPAIALIMLGTNDLHGMSHARYRENMARIVQTSIDMGVIPVLSTIPAQPGWEADVQACNQTLAELSRAYQVPLWDYWGVTQDLPNAGLAEDGIHPSVPPEQTAASAVFTPRNLSYGFPVRNLTALMVLDALWRGVMQ